MKSLFLSLLLLLPTLTPAQALRYFEFTTECGHGNWQDTAFLAAASDQALIDTVLANLSRPFAQRKFISGTIDYGDGDYNHNGSHWFLWHYVPDQWSLVENAIEVCDGCPYTDLDNDTSYWVQTIGQYCPWSGIPVREVSAPTGLDKGWDLPVSLYPNPSRGRITLRTGAIPDIQVTLFNAMGQELAGFSRLADRQVLSLEAYPSGLYFVQASSSKGSKTLPLLLER